MLEKMTTKEAKRNVGEMPEGAHKEVLTTYLDQMLHLEDQLEHSLDTTEISTELPKTLTLIKR